MRLAVVALLVLAQDLLAQLSTEALEARLDEIERVHYAAPWDESQALIDALRDDMASATVDQRARLDIMAARNAMIAGRHEEGIALVEGLLGKPISADRRGRALELAANASLYQQDYGSAFEYLGSALQLMNDIDNVAIRSGILSLASRMHSEVGEPSLALQYAAENRALAERSGDQRTICDGWFTLVEAQESLGFFNFALENTRRLWEACRQSDDPVITAGAMGLIGSVHFSAGHYRESLGWLERAVSANREAGFAGGERTALLTLGRAMIKTGRLDRGIEILMPLAESFEGRGQWGDAHVARLALADAHYEKGEHALAATNLERSREAFERLNEVTRASRLAYLQAEFEDQRRAQQLKLLRQQTQLAELRESNARARRTTRMLGGGTLAIIVLLLVVLLWRFRLDRRRYRRLSELDSLTGLYNHSRFHQRVESALNETRQRPRRVCAMIAADVDLFKQINDRFGHQAGDKVLQSLSALLRERFPPPCIVGRVGGEEFAIFLPDHNRLQARQRIRSLQEAIRPVEYEGRKIEFTLSFGIAESRGARVRLEKLRSSADHALYRAKRAGRNQLVDASDLAEESQT